MPWESELTNKGAKKEIPDTGTSVFIHRIKVREGIYAQEMDIDTAANYLAAIAEAHSQKTDTHEPMIVSLCGNEHEQITKIIKKIRHALTEKKYDSRTFTVVGIEPTDENIENYKSLRERNPDLKIPMLILTTTYIDTQNADHKSAAIFGRLPEIVINMYDPTAKLSTFQIAEGMLESRAIVTSKIIPTEHPKEVPFSIPEIIIVKQAQNKIPAENPQGK